MVQIEVSGPEHSGKGYIMLAIARALREIGVSVTVLGEDTHLEEKSLYDDEVFKKKLENVPVRITELKTRV